MLPVALQPSTDTYFGPVLVVTVIVAVVNLEIFDVIVFVMVFVDGIFFVP